MRITDIHEMEAETVQEFTNDFVKRSVWDWDSVRAFGATFNDEHFGMTIFAPFIIAWEQDLSLEVEGMGIPIEERDLIPTIITDPDVSIDLLNDDGVYFTIAVCAVSDAIHADDADGDYEISILDPDAGDSYPELIDYYFGVFSDSQDWGLVEEILGGDDESFDGLGFLDGSQPKRPTPPEFPLSTAVEDFTPTQRLAVESFDFDTPRRKRPVFGE